MTKLIKILPVLLSLLLAACAERPSDVCVVDTMPPMYPDYVGVTIPAGIAPLNFNVDKAEKVWVEVKGSKDGSLTASGEWADFDIDDWHDLTLMNKGGQLSFDVSAKVDGKWCRYNSFTIDVSDDPLDDYGLTFRKIAPGYEVFSDIGIFQRDIHSFDEEPIVDSRSIPGECMNCHVANRTDPRQMQLHIRGLYSATMVQIDGERRLLQTATDSTIANCMYPYWHPSGNYVAYSLNLIHQCFNESNSHFIEVFDKASDALVLDVRSNQLILSPLLQTDDFETYPAFSADGTKIYYCTSKKYKVPEECDKIQYDLCCVDFDAESGQIGTKVDTLIKASAIGKCITHPRPSYDGKWLMYSYADCSVFPLNHKEADLWIMNLATGEKRPMDGANSDDAESFHNWSSNSRWIVFSSRRLDGVTNRLFISHVDENGNTSKAFLLPQRNPRVYYEDMTRAYNTPDFTLTKVDLDIRAFMNEIYSGERIQVTIKK
ncbi:MAG: hypothetical protein MJZ15_10405 [Bacteroidales bacterium]|nr:hypothetical protein [Bacteroidales bacterium]